MAGVPFMPIDKDRYEFELAVIGSRIATLAGLSGIPEKQILADLTLANYEALTARANRRRLAGETEPPSAQTPDGP